MATEESNGGKNISSKPPPEPSPLRRAKFFKANMRILVTGGAGFIGSHLVDKLMENEENMVIVVDNYFTGSKDNLRQWMDHPRFELIRHEIRIARIFNTYGPRMNIDDGRVVSNFLAQAIRDEPLTVQLPGTQTRSFCYVADMVDGLIRLMEGDSTGPINIGNPGEFTMLELAETVKEMINPAIEIIKVENTPDDPRQRKPDITKAKELLGWEPRIKLQDGIPLMEEDFRKRIGIPRK
ncbi:UNVERIFIED_CONTAM: UDP-glucuronic acid decarboxylase 6 [Sesamum radiatum]|uniref:UDP-glucuronate decarboxylase n=1 Tax=Sesamum radiatum TaxID=300843 RepID=A0AAW2TUU7_SESRA